MIHSTGLIPIRSSDFGPVSEVSTFREHGELNPKCKPEGRGSMRQENGCGAKSMDAGWEDAIKRGDVQDVRDRLNRGADVDARDRHGQTALILAAHAGHRELVEAPLAHRANLNTTAKCGLSALMVAVVTRHAEVARLLADAGTDLSVRG